MIRYQPTLTFFLFSTIFFNFQFSQALQIYSTGNQTDQLTQTHQLICLAGGGSDNDWADGWKALLNASHGGDVVIIRADGARGGYESWLYDDEDHLGFAHVNSVKTIVIESAQDANRPEVEAIILKSELIFFAGGDQSLYIDWFKKSKLAAAVNKMILEKKIPVAGTSAGMALMAGIDFAARFESPNPESNLVTASDVLQNPTADFVDLDNQVLVPEFMKNVITETHFSQRQREGRLVGFLAKALYNRYPMTSFQNLHGIGADEGTAFCYNQKGQGKVFGTGEVYFLKMNALPERLKKNESLNWINNESAITAYVISGKNQNHTTGFDLKLWAGYGGWSESWWVDGADMQSPPHFNRK